MRGDFANGFLEELRDLFRDSGRLLIVVGAPLIYALIYSACYGSEVLHEVPVGVVDEDHSAASRRLIRLVEAGEEVRVATRSSDLMEAERELFRRQIYGIIYIPRGYERALLSGEQGVVALYLDASNFLIYKQNLQESVASLLYTAASVEGARLLTEEISPDDVKARVEPVAYTEHTLYNPRLGYGSFLMPGVVILILQQTLLIGIGMRHKK